MTKVTHDAANYGKVKPERDAAKPELKTPALALGCDAFIGKVSEWQMRSVPDHTKY